MVARPISFDYHIRTHPHTTTQLIALRSVGRIVRPLIAVLLTVIVLWRARPSAVIEAGAHARLSWIALAIALVVLDRGLMAYRWIVLLCPVPTAARPPVRSLLRLFFVSTFAGTFLPASVGGDLVRALGLAQLRVPAAAAVASVLVDRLLGVISILLMGAAGLAIARTDLASTRAIIASLLIGGAGALTASAVVFSERAADLAEGIAARLPFERVRRLGGDITRAARAYSRHHGELANVLAGSLGVQVLRIIQAYCLGRALTIDASLTAYFAFVPLILLVMLLPVSINGIGTSQMAFVWFFGRIGVSEAQAFALSVLFVALGIVRNLPGGFLYAFASRRPD